jgi:hypothetical protein
MGLMLTIKAARPLDGHWIELTLSDGTRIERDIGDLMRGSLFATIRTDPLAFQMVRVRHDTLTWPGDIDLDPAVLIWNGPRNRDPEAHPEPRLVLRHPSAVSATS